MSRTAQWLGVQWLKHGHWTYTCGFGSQLFHLLPVYLWVRILISLELRLLICEKELNELRR